MSTPTNPTFDDILKRATEIAAEKNHDCVTSEHLLLSVLSHERGLKLAREIGVDPDIASEKIEKSMRGMPEIASPGHLPALTPRVKKILALAEKSLRKNLPANAGPSALEHLVGGIFREAEGGAAQVLKSFEGAEALLEGILNLESLVPAPGEDSPAETDATLQTGEAEAASEAELLVRKSSYADAQALCTAYGLDFPALVRAIRDNE